MIRLVNFNREPMYNNLFNRFFEGELNEKVQIPATNIKEAEEAFELKMLVPGIKKEEINIELNENILTISAELENSEENSDWRNEFTIKSFSRSFRLPKTADSESIKAEQTDGILNIKIPKVKEEQKVKKLIEIA